MQGLFLFNFRFKMSTCEFCGKDMSHLNKTNIERHKLKCEKEKKKAIVIQCVL